MLTPSKGHSRSQYPGLQVLFIIGSLLAGTCLVSTLFLAISTHVRVDRLGDRLSHLEARETEIIRRAHHQRMAQITMEATISAGDLPAMYPMDPYSDQNVAAIPTERVESEAKRWARESAAGFRGATSLACGLTNQLDKTVSLAIDNLMLLEEQHISIYDIDYETSGQEVIGMRIIPDLTRPRFSYAFHSAQNCTDHPELLSCLWHPQASNMTLYHTDVIYFHRSVDDEYKMVRDMVHQERSGLVRTDQYRCIAGADQYTSEEVGRGYLYTHSSGRCPYGSNPLLASHIVVVYTYPCYQGVSYTQLSSDLGCGPFNDCGVFTGYLL